MCWLKNKKSFENQLINKAFVDPQGFEPQLMVPKTRVLPLHHGSVYFGGAKL